MMIQQRMMKQMASERREKSPQPRTSNIATIKMPFDKNTKMAKRDQSESENKQESLGKGPNKRKKKKE